METLLPAYSQAMTISYNKPFVGQPSISHQRESLMSFALKTRTYRIISIHTLADMQSLI